MTIEDGGNGFLIGLHRCANFKVPLRDVRYSRKDPVTNRITFAGNAIKHPKGVTYLVDCNVTGSNPGTSTVPCFPLKFLWEHSLMPAIKAMVAPGGPCEGAQVVYQEDNGSQCDTLLLQNHNTCPFAYVFSGLPYSLQRCPHGMAHKLSGPHSQNGPKE